MYKDRAVRLVEKYLSHLLPTRASAKWSVYGVDRKIVIAISKDDYSMNFTILRPAELLKRRFHIALRKKLFIDAKISLVPYPIIQSVKAFRFNPLSAKRKTVKRMIYGQKKQREENASNRKRKQYLSK